MISELRANFSARNFHAELVQRPKNTFSTYRFTTTGIVDIFSHLKNCPALLSHNLIIITSIVLQPVEKQIQVRVPLVLSIHKLFLCVFGTSRIKGTNLRCSWWGLNSRFQIQSLPPTSTFFDEIHIELATNVGLVGRIFGRVDITVVC